MTVTELDDILKLIYKDQLLNKDLRAIMKKYASIQNRVLVDYKKFRDSILTQLKEFSDGYTGMSGLTSDISYTPGKERHYSTLYQMKGTNSLYETLN